MQCLLTRQHLDADSRAKLAKRLRHRAWPEPHVPGLRRLAAALAARVWAVARALSIRGPHGAAQCGACSPSRGACEVFSNDG